MPSSKRPPRKPTSAEEESAADDMPERLTRHVQPLGPRVLVRLAKNPNRLDSGLFVPETAKDNLAQALLGEVVEVARTMPKAAYLVDDDDDDDETKSDAGLGENVSGVPVGSKVLFEKERGVAVPWDDTLRLLEVRHVLAIVDEIPETELQ